MANRVPNTETYNFGIGGSTATVETSTHTGSLEGATSTCFLGMVNAITGTVDRETVLGDYPELLEKMNQLDPAEVDVYVLEYGANDFFSVVPLDHNQTEAEGFYSYYEAMCMGIEQLKNVSPNAKIIVMSPIYNVYKNDDGSYLGDSYIVSNGYGTLSNYAEKAKNIADDCHVFDFDCMFRTYNDLYIDCGEEYLTDGVHLTLTGRQIFARSLAHLVNFIFSYEPLAYLEMDYINISTFDPEETYRMSDELFKNTYPEQYEKMLNGQYKLVQPEE